MAEQQRETFQLGPDGVPVILLKGELGAGQQRDGLAQLVGAQAGQRVADQLASVLPHPMLVKQGTQRRMG